MVIAKKIEELALVFRSYVVKEAFISLLISRNTIVFILKVRRINFLIKFSAKNIALFI